MLPESVLFGKKCGKKLLKFDGKCNFLSNLGTDLEPLSLKDISFYEGRP